MGDLKGHESVLLNQQDRGAFAIDALHNREDLVY